MHKDLGILQTDKLIINNIQWNEGLNFTACVEPVGQKQLYSEFK